MCRAFDISTNKTWKKIAGNISPTLEMLDIVERYKLQSKHNWAVKFLATSSKHNLDNVTERFEKYHSLKPFDRKGNNLRNCVLRFGEELGTAFYKEKNSKSVQTLANFINRYGEQEGLDRYKKCNELKSGNRESYILRHGVEEGTKRYEKFCARNRGNHSVERKIEKGMNAEEAVLKVRATRERMRKNTSLAGFIEKYGLDDGTRLFGERHKRFRHFSTAEGFKEKYGDEYKEKLRLCKDSYSIESYIRRYGETEGKTRHEQHCRNVKYRTTLPFFIEKYGEERGAAAHYEYKSRCAFKSHSNVSQQLFDAVKQYASDNIYYATHNKEFLIISGNDCYFFDFVDNDTKRVIEFNGDIFHANPEIYSAEDKPNPYRKDLTAVDIWELDKRKNESILKRGYELLIVWEKDYRSKYDNVIDECKNFLKYGKR